MVIPKTRLLLTQDACVKKAFLPPILLVTVSSQTKTSALIPTALKTDPFTDSLFPILDKIPGQIST